MNAFLRTSMLAFVLLASGGALAQPKPALVQDRDAPAREPYQQFKDRAMYATDDGSIKTLTFPAVPAGKRLVITFVNMSFSIGPLGADGVYFALICAGQPDSYLFMPSSTNGNMRIVAMPIMYYCEPGTVPMVHAQQFSWNEGSLLSATLVGYYVSLP